MKKHIVYRVYDNEKFGGHFHCDTLSETEATFFKKQGYQVFEDKQRIKNIAEWEEQQFRKKLITTNWRER